MSKQEMPNLPQRFFNQYQEADEEIAQWLREACETAAPYLEITAIEYANEVGEGWWAAVEFNSAGADTVCEITRYTVYKRATLQVAVNHLVEKLKRHQEQEEV